MSKSPIGGLVAPFRFSVDNDIQAPLVQTAWAAAIDLPSPFDTSASNDDLQPRNSQLIESTSASSSTSTRKGKSGTLGLNTDEAQKKLGKFFKGLGQSMAPSLTTKLTLTIFTTRKIVPLLPFASLILATCVRTALGSHQAELTEDVHPTTLPPFPLGHLFSR